MLVAGLCSPENKDRQLPVKENRTVGIGRTENISLVELELAVVEGTDGEL